MSDYKFNCPNCQQRISATDEYIGHELSCPSCHATITVPAPAGHGAASSIATPLPPGMPPPPAPPAVTRLSIGGSHKGGESAPPAPESGASSIATPLPPGMPPPPAPPAASKLGVSALNAQKEGAASHAAPSAAHSNPLEQMGSAKYQEFKARKSKTNYTGIIVGSCCAVAAAVCLFVFKDKIVSEYHSVRGTPEVVVDTNTPPPPPPELTVDEVWQKVASTYKAMAGYSGSGTAVSSLDYSQINRTLSANGPRVVTEDLTLKMNRPDEFRIDLVEHLAANNVLFTGWSAGQGDYVQLDTNRSKMGSPFPVFTALSRVGSALGGALLTELYFNTSDSVPVGGIWTRDDDQTLNGHACYVLTGTLFMHDAQVWVDRGTFLISQVAFTLNGQVYDDNSLDDGKLKSALMASGVASVTPADLIQFKRTLKAQSKLKGVVTETFTDTQPNATLAMSDFQPSQMMNATSAPMTQGGDSGNPPPGRGLGGSGPGGVAGRLRRQGNPPPDGG